MDERVTVKGSDDGASETSDGIHYSNAGAVLVTAAWLAAIQ